MVLVVRGALLARDPPAFDVIAALNDGLRTRANRALIAYLCAEERVSLPFATTATGTPTAAASPRDLSALLLYDVEPGTCERTSRIAQAVASVQTFVQRIRLGLEPGYTLPPGFRNRWEGSSGIASFGGWRTRARHRLYGENWIQWEELETSRRSEAFRFLERGLAERDISLPEESAAFATTGSMQLPGPDAGFPDLQSARWSTLAEQTNAPDEGTELLATPFRDGQPSWLAPPYLDSTPAESDSGNETGSSAVTKVPRIQKKLISPPPSLDQVNIPMWFQAAVRMGTTFMRIAAAALPPAMTSALGGTSDVAGPCCCGKVHAPIMDEYYFWLDEGKWYDDSLVPQDATLGVVAPDPTTDWERPDKAPGLLYWPASTLVYLRWTRVRCGEFGPPRRSAEGAPFDADSEQATLAFNGRQADSLLFGAVGSLGIGFRYDIANDTAVLDPPPVAQAYPTETYPTPFPAFPFFVYFQPGAPIAPASSFATVLSVAGTLRAQCRFEEALAWCRAAFDPLTRQNSWPQCQQNQGRGEGGENLHADNKTKATAPPALPEKNVAVGESKPVSTGVTDATPASSTGPGTAAPVADSASATHAKAVTIVTGSGEGGTCCPTSPVKAGVGRARAVLLEYVQTLLQWGDSLFCRGTPEARNQALGLYDEAIRLLGPRPQKVCAGAAASSSSSGEGDSGEENERDDEAKMTVGNFVAAAAPLNPRLLELYAVAYDRRDLVRRCLSVRRLKAVVPGWRQGGGFGGGNGACSSSAYENNHWFDDASCEPDCCWMMPPENGLSAGGLYQCGLPYKFTFLLSKALELVGLVKSLGGQLLSALEKSDTEYLASLRQSYETQANELTLVTKQNAWREADWQVQALDSQMQGAQQRLRYNQGLINAGLNSGENGYLSGTQVSMTSRTAGSITEGVGQAMNFIPDFNVGGAGAMSSPVAVTQLPLGTKLAAVFQAAARILNIVADVAGTNAAVSNTQGSWERRSDEWAHQVDVISIELEQIKQQQLAAERRRAMALRDLNNHQAQIEHSTEVDAFMAGKLTKQDLYLFLQQETAGMYRRLYELAWQTTSEARAALRYERRDLSLLAARSLPPSLGPGAWDRLHEGLLAGERLEVALRGLERAYLRESGCREYELTKHISLRLQLPLAFLQLKTLGWCEFELPEWTFDLDYPGHYLRRIKNLSVTIPCVVGPYVGVHCRVQLLSSGLRLEPTLPMAGKCCCKKGKPCIGIAPANRGPHRGSRCPSGRHQHTLAGGGCGCVDVDGGIGGNSRYCETRYASPASLSLDFLPGGGCSGAGGGSTEAIATSTGQNDSGLFELTFHDERLRAPFEFAGAAASRWRIELPPSQNAFDLASLADFVLHLSYTAREGGPALRDVAERAAVRRLPGDGVRFFDLKNEFPGEWSGVFGPRGGSNSGEIRQQELLEEAAEEIEEEVELAPPKRGGQQKWRNRGPANTRGGSRKTETKRERVFGLRFSRRSFPFITGRRAVVITSVHIFVDAGAPAETGEHFSVEFVPEDGYCEDGRKTIVCNNSSDGCEGLYHGVLSGVRMGPLWEDDGRVLGRFRFPESLGRAKVRQAYFLCSYEAVERQSA